MANFIEINSADDPRVAIFSQLTEAQLRNRLEPEKGIFIAESPKVIRVALQKGLRPSALLAERRHLVGDAKDIVEACGESPVYTGDSQVLASLTGYELTRGVLAAFPRLALPSVEAICEGKRRIAVIDNVVNATNTGAIFRAATALGIDAILLTPTCCDPLNRRSVRVSMGTVFQIPWTFIGESCSDWPHLGMSRLSFLGFKTAALALSDNSIAIDDDRLSHEPKLAILMGTEGDGLAKATIDAADYVVKIPMQNGVDSLNVAAAASVAFWQLRSR